MGRHQGRGDTYSKEGLAINGSTLDPGQQASLTTARWPFLALVMRSSEPDVKSMMPSLPGPPANVMLEARKNVKTCSQRRTPEAGPFPGSTSHPNVLHLPWLMLILLTRSALRAVLVSVSIT